MAVRNAIYIFLMALLFGLQISSTIINKNFWPIASFNVFAHSVDKRVWVTKVILIDAEGNEAAFDPGEVLPVEFFRARSILVGVLSAGDADNFRDKFADDILWRLQNRRWDGFDEVLPPADFKDPKHLRLEYWLVSPTIERGNATLRVFERVVGYQSDSEIESDEAR